MLQLVVLIFAGWLVTNYGRPLMFAGTCAGVICILAIVFGAGVAAALLNGVVALVFAVPYFWLIERYSDTVVIWLAVLVGFPVCWFVVVSQVL